MTKEEVKDYATHRIDALLDDRILDLKEDIKGVGVAVKDLHKMLVGNGSEGLIQKVERNSAKVKILCWLGSMIVGAVIGSYIKTADIDLSKMDPAVAKQVIELLKVNQ